MEVVSALGLAASVANILDLSTTCIKLLLELRASYKISDLNIQVSVAQLSTLKAAMTQITMWKCDSPSYIPYHLGTDLDLSLKSCKILIDGLNDQLSPLRLNGTASLSFKRKAQFLLSGREWNQLQTLLNHQIAAIHLFLTTMQCQTQAEQEAFLRRSESRKILSSVRDDTSSLLWLRDDNSSGTRRSTCTESSEFLDASFVFDAEVLKSKAYIAAMRSTMKQAVRGSAKKARQRLPPSRHSESNSLNLSTAVEHGRGKESTAVMKGLQSAEASISSFSTRHMQDEASEHLSVEMPHFRPQESADEVEDMVGAMLPSVLGLEEQNNQNQVFEQQSHRKIRHLQSFFRSRGSLSSASRTSFNTGNGLRNIESAPVETQILLMGTSRRTAFCLQRSMKLAYGQYYTKANKEAFRTSILHGAVETMKDLLFLMGDFGLTLQNVDNERHATCLLSQPWTLDWKYLPPDISIALTELWRDEGVVEAFHRRDAQSDCHDTEYFFNSIRRISEMSYEPSLEDMSRASLKGPDIQNVVIPRKSTGKRFNYRFIDNFDIDSSGSQFIYTSEEVSLVVHVVDTATYDVMYPDQENCNGIQKDLMLLKQICSSRWLAETPVLILLSNTDEMKDKLRQSPVRDYFEDFSADPTNEAHVKAYFRELFLHSEKKYNMRVWVEFLGSGVTAKIGQNAIGIIDKVFTEETVLHYGLR